MISSAALPNVAFSNPPTVGPVWHARSSVARPISPAAGIRERAAVRNTQSGACCAAASQLIGIAISRTFSQLEVIARRICFATDTAALSFRSPKTRDAGSGMRRAQAGRIPSPDTGYRSRNPSPDSGVGFSASLHAGSARRAAGRGETPAPVRHCSAVTGSRYWRQRRDFLDPRQPAPQDPAGATPSEPHRARRRTARRRCGHGRYRMEADQGPGSARRSIRVGHRSPHGDPPRREPRGRCRVGKWPLLRRAGRACRPRAHVRGGRRSGERRTRRSGHRDQLWAVAAGVWWSSHDAGRDARDRSGALHNRRRDAAGFLRTGRGPLGGPDVPARNGTASAPPAGANRHVAVVAHHGPIEARRNARLGHRRDASRSAPDSAQHDTGLPP